MTYPFSAGQVLTAADLNAYAGLILIKQQTIGSGVASVTVTNAFSSTFYNYRIVIANGYSSTLNVARFTFQSQSGNFYGNRLSLNSGSTTITNINTGGPGTSYAEIANFTTSREGHLAFDVYSPYTARRKGLTGNYCFSGYNGIFGYQNSVTDNYTGFVLTASTGVFNGGEIFVYGYNNG